MLSARGAGRGQDTRPLQAGCSTRNKISRVRWAPLTSVRTRRQLFATGSYDAQSPLVTIWYFDPAPAPGPGQGPGMDILSQDDMGGASRKASFATIASAHARGGVTGLEFLDDGARIMASTEDGYLQLFRIGSKPAGQSGLTIDLVSESRPHARSASHLAGCSAFALSRHGGMGSEQQVASAGGDGRVVWSTLDGRAVHEIRQADSMSLTALQWRTSSQVATASLSGRICVFDSRADSAVLAFSENTSRVHPLYSLAVHPTQSDRLVTGSESGYVQLWDLRNTSAPESTEVKAHDSIVWEMQFAQGEGGCEIWGCSEDGSLSSWTSPVIQSLSSGVLTASSGLIGSNGERLTRFSPASQLSAAATSATTATTATTSAAAASKMAAGLSLNSFSIHPGAGAVLAAGDGGQLSFAFVQ
ncbi:WD40-repeat-containing domain protein [Entophlyctis helioformis]|nr:WD40-repeat-containing domain protein [Entophlyctis helioformis]